MKKEYEKYDFEKDTEHIKMFGSARPLNRDEEIRWAGMLANATGKKVEINAMTLVPNKPITLADHLQNIGCFFGILAISIFIVISLIIVFAIATGRIV